MHRTINPPLDHGLWWAIQQRAREDSRSERVMRAPAGSQNLGETEEPVLTEDAEADMLLELALRHLDDQHFSSQEAGMIASAIREVLEQGQPRRIGPVGRRRRCYHVDRRDSAVSLRAGEGRILLPPDRAARLAEALGEFIRRNTAGSVAA